jgi:hypothetical protein
MCWVKFPQRVTLVKVSKPAVKNTEPLTHHPTRAVCISSRLCIESSAWCVETGWTLAPTSYSGKELLVRDRPAYKLRVGRDGI